MRAVLAGRARRGTPAVWYGLERLPSIHEPAVGGVVKLQHLAARFPNERVDFNLLYLVTSRLPDAPETLAAWARRKGARIILNQNGVAYPAWHGRGWERANAPMAALLASADHVFYQSEFCRLSADRFAGRAAGRSEILYNAVDTRHFVPAPRRASGRLLVLLLGGSQDQWYRVDAAVRALVLVVGRGLDAELLITGRLGWSPDAAMCRRELDTLIAALDLSSRVRIAGPYSQADAPALFQRAHVLLHTKYNDPCPTVVVEGLACGLPVVHSQSGGVPELVGDDAGIGVPAELSWDHDIPPDPAALADAVIRVRERLAQHAQAARQRAVDRFDIRPWLARHAEVFESLAS